MLPDTKLYQKTIIINTGWPLWFSWFNIVSYIKRLQVQFLVSVHTQIASSIPIQEATNQCFTVTWMSFILFYAALFSFEHY